MSHSSTSNKRSVVILLTMTFILALVYFFEPRIPGYPEAWEWVFQHSWLVLSFGVPLALLYFPSAAKYIYNIGKTIVCFSVKWLLKSAATSLLALVLTIYVQVEWSKEKTKLSDIEKSLTESVAEFHLAGKYPLTSKEVSWLVCVELETAKVFKARILDPFEGIEGVYNLIATKTLIANGVYDAEYPRLRGEVRNAATRCAPLLLNIH